MEEAVERSVCRKSSVLPDVLEDPLAEEVPDAGLMGCNTDSEALGVSHVAGCYSFGEPFLQAGVRLLKEAGFGTVKLWLCANAQQHYPREQGWPAYRRMCEQAADLAYTEVFREKGIHTYFLEAIPFSWAGFDRQVKPEDWQALYEEFYDLAAYLLSAYRHSGKRFVLQNWEGDWLYSGTYDTASSAFEDPLRIRNFRQYLCCMQMAIADARGSVRTMQREQVWVFGCAEVNLLIGPDDPRQPEENRFAVNRVIPYTQMDLYSYSNYQSWQNAAILRRSIIHYRKRAPRSVAFGRYNIILGEYGAPEREYGTQYQQCITAVQTRVMREEFHAPYHLYWQLYCNECTDEGQRGRGEGQRGFWLIRPDKSRTLTYWWLLHYLGRDVSSRFCTGEAAAFLEWMSEDGWMVEKGDCTPVPCDSIHIQGETFLGINCEDATHILLKMRAATACAGDGLRVRYLTGLKEQLGESTFREREKGTDTVRCFESVAAIPQAARYAELRIVPDPTEDGWIVKGIYLQKGIVP